MTYAVRGKGVRNLSTLRLSVAEAACRLRLSRQTLHTVLAGRQVVTADVALRLERLGCGTARLWLSIQTGHDIEAARWQLADVLDGIKPAA